MKRMFITDSEAARVMEISTRTLSSILNGYRRGGKLRKSAGYDIDLLTAAKPMVIGGYRRWNVALLANALSLSVDEVMDRLGIS